MCIRDRPYRGRDAPVPRPGARTTQLRLVLRVLYHNPAAGDRAAGTVVGGCDRGAVDAATEAINDVGG
eukprot:698955-Rhodomonas_salina.2